MAVTLITPVIRPSPQVVKWVLNNVGADDAHVIGHNNALITAYCLCSQGAAELVIEVSPDGQNWLPAPTSPQTLSAGQAIVTSFASSAHSVRPKVTSVTQEPLALTVYIVATRA